MMLTKVGGGAGDFFLSLSLSFYFLQDLLTEIKSFMTVYITIKQTYNKDEQMNQGSYDVRIQVWRETLNNVLRIVLVRIDENIPICYDPDL